MRRTRAGGPARGSEIPRAAPWVLASPLTGEVAAQQPEGVHGEGQSPSPAARSRLTATYFSLVRKVGKSQRLRLWGRTLQKPFLLTAPKETVFEIQRKALTGPSVHPTQRPARIGGRSKRRFPLPRPGSNPVMGWVYRTAPGGDWIRGCPQPTARAWREGSGVRAVPGWRRISASPAGRPGKRPTGRGP